MVKKISIPIINKLNIVSKRTINSVNKKFYEYNKKRKAYVKKSKIAIEKIKFIKVSNKKEKKVSKKVIKQVQIIKEKVIAEKIKEEIIKVPKKIKVPEKIEIEEKHDLTKGYLINTYQFGCKVSDRKIVHDFSIRDEIDTHLLEMHENKYPDHEVLRIDFLNERFIEYGKGKAFSGDYATDKQKEFLKMLGLKPEIIQFIKSKQEASSIIIKMNKKR